MSILIGILVCTFVLLLTNRPGPHGRPRRLPIAWPPIPTRARRRSELTFVDSLIGELTVGRDPLSALVTAAEASDPPVAHNAWVAARTGGDIGVALMSESSDTLRSVGACWIVASTSGAGLVKALTSIAESARARERNRQAVEVAVAEPRAAALVVALLPGVGLGMGSMLGSSPFGWLLGTTIGRVILLSAMCLELLGCWWSWHIIQKVRDPS